MSATSGAPVLSDEAASAHPDGRSAALVIFANWGAIIVLAASLAYRYFES